LVLCGAAIKRRSDNPDPMKTHSEKPNGQYFGAKKEAVRRQGRKKKSLLVSTGGAGKTNLKEN